MSLVEFQEWFARDVPGGWPALAPFIRAVPCDCGEDCCRGWSTTGGRDVTTEKGMDNG